MTETSKYRTIKFSVEAVVERTESESADIDSARMELTKELESIHGLINTHNFVSTLDAEVLPGPEDL